MTIKQMRWYKYHPTGYRVEMPEYERVAIEMGIPDEVSISVSIVNLRNSCNREIVMRYYLPRSELSVIIPAILVGEKQEFVHIKEAFNRAKKAKGLPKREKITLDLLLMELEKE